MEKLAAGSTFESINSNEIKMAEINVPKKEEQEKIGSYLAQFDNLITLHQREYEKLVLLKKAMLSKMFI